MGCRVATNASHHTAGSFLAQEGSVRWDGEPEPCGVRGAGNLLWCVPASAEPKQETTAAGDCCGQRAALLWLHQPCRKSNWSRGSRTPEGSPAPHRDPRKAAGDAAAAVLGRQGRQGARREHPELTALPSRTPSCLALQRQDIPTSTTTFPSRMQERAVRQLGTYCKWHHLLLTWQFLCRPGPRGRLRTGTGTSAHSELLGSTSTSSVTEPRAGSGGPSGRLRTRDNCLGWRRSRAAALCPQSPSVPQLPLILSLSTQGTAQSPCPGSSSAASDLAQSLGGWGNHGGCLGLALPGPGRAISRQEARGGSRTPCPGQEVFWDAAEPSRLCTSPWKPYFVAASPARRAASSREAAAVDSSLLPSAAT